ncbi:hypothetical protein EVAR_46826_1 [Eumeta japonica]|uniref:Uncharacterized protein n=1 Tax=Eumeta variegata TaxID=151549 RepID=A0A4C1SSE4_EUMVA|nr:hypothetical protein EVAR_46826_1 [Eumeta japonica]
MRFSTQEAANGHSRRPCLMPFVLNESVSVCKSITFEPKVSITDYDDELIDGQIKPLAPCLGSKFKLLTNPLRHFQPLRTRQYVDSLLARNGIFGGRGSGLSELSITR